MLINQGMVALMQRDPGTSGQARRAAQLFGAAETVRSGPGASSTRVLAPLVCEATRAATAALGASKFQAEFTSGQRLHRGHAIALGSVNRRTCLFISDRTVDNHVRTILNRLGFNSRAQIAV